MPSLFNFVSMVNGKLIQYDDMLVKYGHGGESGGDTPEPTGSVIGGRWYRTVTIGGKEWLAENLDYTFDGLTIGLSKNTDEYPAANYYNQNEEEYKRIIVIVRRRDFR